MRRALYLIQHVDVIGQDTCVKQRIAQRRQRVGVVVDAAQQHTLVQQGDAGQTQLRHGSLQFTVNLIGMIDVRDHQYLQA
ncbi:hypothetical protein D3C80_971410 [compost metagenome]